VQLIKSYFKIAFRNLLRQKGYSIINITGLAIGMACSIIIFLWVQDELSYDKFNENADRIYRVIQNIQFTDHQTTWAITQGPLAPSLKKDFPEIVEAARIDFREFRLQYGNDSFDENICMADPSLFNMFTFPFVAGNPQTALSNPHSIVLSEEMASKYFGDQDPLGNTIRIDNQYDFSVTGVLKTIPHNSNLQFDFIIPFVFGRELGYTVDIWGNSRFLTFVMLAKNNSAPEVIQRISDYLKDKPTLEENAKLNLQPLTAIHLYSNFEFERFETGDIKYVTIFTVVAIFILVIASINFMNLATARSGKRAREIGLRKVVGAKRSNIIRQFLGEAVLLSFVAFVFSIVLIEFFLPIFNEFSGKQLSLDLNGHTYYISIFVCFVIITGLLSGSYPALFLSSFKPVTVLKGSSIAATGNTSFRKVLVVIQFALSIILITGTVVIYNQLDFMRNKKLGFNKEQLLLIRMRGDLRDNFESLKDELLKNPNIVNATATSNPPTSGYSFSNSRWNWEGKNPEDEILMRANFVDYGYFETFGMKMVQGRSYSKDFATDTSEAIIVNETAVKVMGMKSPLGKHLGAKDYYPKIIGVVKDFNFRSLHSPIEPLILILAPNYCQVMCIRINSHNLPEMIGYIRNLWRKFVPDHPFEYRFLDESLNNLYQAEQRIGKIIDFFTFLAIFIACLGLFGLVSFMAEQRTKEIGIRKVLGSSIPGIVSLLSKEFLKWVLIANFIAWPIAYLVMNRWLENFAYRIDIGIWTFVLAGVLALFIALLTVSTQAIRAALANPVESLRYE
jgi:putative ABC transport system permease protein